MLNRPGYHTVCKTISSAGVELVSIRTDQTFPRHTHEDFGIGFMAYGGHESWSGRGKVAAHAFDIITVNPGELHDGIGIKGNPREWHMLNFQPDFLHLYTDKPFSSLEFHDPAYTNREHLRLLKRIVRLMLHNDADLQLRAELLIALFNHVFEPSLLKSNKVRNYSYATKTMVEFIKDNWNKEVSLQEIASAANLDRFTAIRRFSGEIGTTPYAWLIQYRINKVHNMLRQGAPLCEAALQAQFSDQSHMQRVFKTYRGFSPGHLQTTV